MVTRSSPRTLSVARAWRLIWETLVGRPAGDRAAELRHLVARARFFGVNEATIVELVARRMYEDALAAGGHECDLGVLGPGLFRRDARRLLSRT